MGEKHLKTDDKKLVSKVVRGPDVPCPRCKSTETMPIRRFGYPLRGSAEDTTEWECLECDRRFDGPLVKR